MLARTSTKTLNNIKSTLSIPNRQMAVIHNFKRPTMAELPVPAGSWSQAYAIRQRSNNAFLIVGLTLFSISLGVFLKSGVIKDFGRGPTIGVNEE